MNLPSEWVAHGLTYATAPIYGGRQPWNFMTCEQLLGCFESHFSQSRSPTPAEPEG